MKPSTKIDLKVMPFALLLGLAIGIFIVQVYFEFMFDDFERPDLLEKLKPEYQDKLTFYSEDGVVNIFFTGGTDEENRSCMGVYDPIFNKIIITSDEKVRGWNKVEELLCHEICHYKWDRISDEEKKIWEDKFEKIEHWFKEDDDYFDPEEIYAFWCMDNLNECFMEE